MNTTIEADDFRVAILSQNGETVSCRAFFEHHGQKAFCDFIMSNEALASPQASEFARQNIALAKTHCATLRA